MTENYTFGHWGRTSEEILESQFPLHKACRDGDTGLLSQLLLDAQHGIYVEDSFYGWTPAHWAAYFGKLNCLMKLVEHGMCCDATVIRLNQVPLHIAAFAGEPHCLKWLLHSGAGMDRQDYLGETPAHKAARSGSMECVSLLASHGAKLFIRSNNGNTPSQLAAVCGHAECAKYLEAMAVRQQHLPKGVYENDLTCKPITPEPHDITAGKATTSIIKQGINGGCLPPEGAVDSSTANHIPGGYNLDAGLLNGHSVPLNGSGDAYMNGDCEMEADSATFESQGMEMSCKTAGLVNGFGGHSHDKDITLLPEVSLNKIPIAGRKRNREDADELEHKRMRRAGSEDNLTGMVDVELDFEEADTEVESRPSNNNDAEMNGHCNGSLSYPCSCGTPHEPEVDDYVGYDYHGILHFPEKPQTPSPVKQARALENGTVTPSKCVALAGHFI